MYTPSDLHRRNDRLDSDREWRKRMDQPSQYNRYAQHLEDFRKNQMLDAESERAIALENRRQLGQLNITKLQDAGQTARTQMVETGLNRRSDIEQANIMKGRGDTLAFDREKFDFGKTKAERSFAVDRDKALFDQFAKMKGLDNVGLGGNNPGTQGDIMGQWNTFRNNASGMTNQTLDFAIAKKHNDAKAKGLSFDKINFTDAERSRLVGGTNDGGPNANQNSTNRLDWIEGKDGRRRFFNQRGDEVAFNAPSSRSDFSGVSDQLMASHRSGAGAPQVAASGITTGSAVAAATNAKRSPYEGYTNANLQNGYVWGLDPQGQSRRMFKAQRPVLSSGLPNNEFPDYLNQMSKFNQPVSDEDKQQYQSAYDRMMKTNYSYRK